MKKGDREFLATTLALWLILFLFAVPNVWAEEENLGVFVQMGHSSSIKSVSFSPDGRYLASGSMDDSVKLWDVNTGREIRTFKGHSKAVESVSFSPDGRYLASGSTDETIKLWDVNTGREIRTFSGNSLGVKSVAFSKDGHYLASGGWSGLVKLWDVETGREIRPMKRESGLVNSVAFSPDGRYIASGSCVSRLKPGYEDIKLWDVNTGRDIRTLKGHTGDVRSVLFNQDGRYLASGSADGTLRLWNAETGREILSFKGHRSDVTSISFSPDGRYLASGSADDTVKLWDVQTGREMNTLKGHSKALESVSFSPDGRYLASGSTDKTIKLWDVNTGREIRTMGGDAPIVWSVIFSPDGRYLAAGNDKTIRLWDAKTGRGIRTFVGHSSRLTSLSFSPDSRFLASGGRDNTVKLWDVETGREIRKFLGDTESIAFSPDGRYLASGSAKRTIKLWDVETGQEIRTMKGHSGWVVSLSFSPDGRSLASGSWDETVKLWDVETGREIHTFEKRLGTIESVAFSPDGRSLAAGGSFNTIELWDVETGSKIHKLDKHVNDVKFVAFSPDGRYLASGSKDYTVKLWDVETGSEIRTLRGHSNNVSSVAFSPDARYLASGSWDSSIKMWNLLDGKEIVTLTDFTDGEWISITPEGYFDCSTPLAADKINIRKDLIIKSVSDFWDVFFRPDIVRTKLDGSDIRPLIGSLTIQEALKNPPPSVSFLNAIEAVDQKNIIIGYSIQQNGGGIGEIRVFQNGKLIQSDGYYKDSLSSLYVPVGQDNLKAKQYIALQRSITKVPLKNGDESVVSPLVIRTAKEKKCNPCNGEVEVEVLPGEQNTISAVAFNRDNTIQSSPVSTSFSSTLKKVEPTLWLLAIGINQFEDIVHLKNARKDALDFACIYAGREAMGGLATMCSENGAGTSVYQNGRIQVIDVLFDETAKKQTILKKLQEVAEKTQPQDVFLLFVASHGEIDGSGQYSFAAYDTKCIDSQCSRLQNQITSSNLLEASKKIKAMTQLLILDTCHSGGLDNKISGLYDARMSILAKNMGLHLYASAQATDVALDGEPGTNGLFTSNLLEGIKGDASKDENGKISIVTLGDYAEKKTVEQTSFGQKQMPLIQHFGKDCSLVSP